MDKIRRRIAQAIRDQGLSYKSVSQQLGRNPAYIQQFLHRNVPEKLPETTRGRLADILDISEQDLGAPAPRMMARNGRGIPNLAVHDSPRSIVTLSGAKDRLAEISNDPANGRWQLPDSVLTGRNNLEQICALPVIGDSMDPLLPNGSTVFIDTSHTRPAPEDIYAIDIGDGVTIKRIKPLPKSDRVLVISENSRYAPDELNRTDLVVFGRVVAWFQWRG